MPLNAKSLVYLITHVGTPDCSYSATENSLFTVWFLSLETIITKLIPSKMVWHAC